MDPSLNDLLINLKILSSIGTQDKICTIEKTFNLHTPTPYRSWYRLYYRETRHKNMLDIENCIHDCFRNENRDRIKCAIRTVPNGLTKLGETYKGDATIYSRIQVLIENINLFVSDHDKLMLESIDT